MSTVFSRSLMLVMLLCMAAGQRQARCQSVADTSALEENSADHLKVPDPMGGYFPLPPLQRAAELQSDRQPFRPIPDKLPGHSDWLFVWLASLLLLLALIRAQFSRDLKEWIRALWNQNLAHQLQRDREFALTPHGLLLFLLYASAMGTWVWLMLHRLEVQRLPFLGEINLAACIIGVIFVVYLRDALRRLTGLLFHAEEPMAFFGFEITLLQALAGAVLLPFLFFMAYAPAPAADAATTGSLILLGGLFAWRSFRGLQAGAKARQRNGFAFVLYICSLEIAPLALAVKGLTNWLSIG